MAKLKFLWKFIEDVKQRDLIKMKNKIIVLCLLMILFVNFVIADGIVYDKKIAVTEYDDLDIIDYPVDINNNGLYDYLVFETDFIVSETGKYKIYAELEDDFGNRISIENEIRFNADENIKFNYSGVNIYMNGIDSSYKLIGLAIKGNNNFKMIFTGNLYNSSVYNYEDFERSGASFTGVFLDYGIDKN